MKKPMSQSRAKPRGERWYLLGLWAVTALLMVPTGILLWKGFVLGTHIHIDITMLLLTLGLLVASIFATIRRLHEMWTAHKK